MPIRDRADLQHYVDELKGKRERLGVWADRTLGVQSGEPTGLAASSRFNYPSRA